MHSQARAFSQPTRANIHQYQFNNPIILSSKSMILQILLYHTCAPMSIVIEIRTANYKPVANSVKQITYQLKQN